MKRQGRWLELLRAEQQADGSFLGWTSPERYAAEPRERYRSTFVSAQIVQALAEAQLPEAGSILEGASAFLKTQFLDGSANYWSRNSEEFSRFRLPDDMDDTACALAALVAAQPALKQDGELLGQFTRALIECETQPGGPFHTWRISPEAEAKWLDVDVAVNANIAFVLSALDVSLDPLWAYLDEAVAQNRFASPYYPDQIAILLFLSRLPRPAWRESLLKAWMSLRQSDGSWGNSLNDSLATISLRKLDAPRETYISVQAKLIESEVEGSHAFCLDPAQQGVTYFAGSPALEAALRIQACAGQAKSEVAPISAVPENDPMHTRVLKEVRSLLPNPETELGRRCEAMIQRIEGFDSKRQITLTPKWIARALDRDISEDLIARLGRANVLGWAAYTAFDDVLDGDAGPELVSPAALFLRRMSDEFSAIHPQHAEFQAWWRSIIDRIDAANADELAFMRNPAQPPAMPDIRGFAERSLGHAIPAVAIMIEEGYAIHSAETQALFEAFRWYITARQLHDDAHDWETDVKRGQLNSASLRLRDALSEDAPSDFWTRAIVEHCDDVFLACKKGRECIVMCSPIQRPELLMVLFDRIEQGTREALEGRETSLAFIKSMHGK